MTKKQEFAKRVAEKTGLEKDVAETVVDAVYETAAEVLVEEDKVTLGNLGTLKKADRAARKGRNPSTGEEIDIPAKTVSKFKESKVLSSKLNS